ncbi:MAG: DUF362 domain-containing protein [Bryobacteraceae bacterium]
MTAPVTRRQALASLGVVAALPRFVLAKDAPAAPVALARCRSYDEDLYGKLGTMCNQVGGLHSLVKNKTVALKLNLTGNPSRFPWSDEMPYRTNPNTVLATVRLLARAGAKRVRIIESFFPATQDMALWARYDLDIQAINNAGCKVEWENVQNLGKGSKYVRLKVPWGGYMFPAYHLNHSFVDCDTYVSLSKMKNHWIAGVTMSLKNNFGDTPCSLYGGDCGASGNENPTQERGPVCHAGRENPPKGIDAELDPSTPRDPGYRVPRIAVDQNGIRPVDLAIVDGIDTVRGGEGTWIKGLQRMKPGVLLVGRNGVCVDAVGMAVMGYDPRADRGTKPFVRGDSALKLAEAVGLGTTDLSRIDIRGLKLKDAVMDFGPGPIGKTIPLPVQPA